MLRIASSHPTLILELSAAQENHLRVSLTSPDHWASCNIHVVHGLSDLVQLFVDAARDWKGWDGLRSWESIEHDLKLELRNVRGSVRLGVTIDAFAMNNPWKVSAELDLDGGQLDELAREAVRTWPKS